MTTQVPIGWTTEYLTSHILIWLGPVLDIILDFLNQALIHRTQQDEPLDKRLRHPLADKPSESLLKE